MLTYQAQLEFCTPSYPENEKFEALKKDINNKYNELLSLIKKYNKYQPNILKEFVVKITPLRPAFPAPIFLSRGNILIVYVLVSLHDYSHLCR